MEPFGLLNFIKTLLSSPDFSQNTPNFNMENKDNFDNKKSENIPDAKIVSQENSAPDFQEKSEAQNAFTQFMSAHDQRVKRIRKD